MTNEGLARDARVIEVNERRFGTDLVLDSIARSLYPQLETFHIYSLSKRPDNQHLWERYAGKHTGYCLEFLNEESFQPAFEVRYGDIALDITNPEQFRPFFLFYKARLWSKEEEIRMITHRNTNAIVVFDPRLLTRLILGMKIAPTDAMRIRAWASERNPPLIVVNETEMSAAVTNL